MCNSISVISRLLRHTAGAAMVVLLGFQPITTLEANDQTALPSPRQSLLFEVTFELNGADLRLLRRIMPELPGPETESSRAFSRDAPDGMVSPTVFQDSNFSGVPHAQWLDRDGHVIAITSFEEPRILRSPQNGHRTHGAIVAQRTSHFLLRGPGDAVTVNLYLPSLDMQTAHVLPLNTPENTPRLDATARANPATSTSRSQGVAQPQQSWRIDLSL